MKRKRRALGKSDLDQIVAWDKVWGKHFENFHHGCSTSEVFPCLKPGNTTASHFCFEGTDLLWKKHCEKQEASLFVLFSKF